MLQGKARQENAKKEVDAVRQQKAEEAEKEVAITKIQGIQRQKVRGKLGRRMGGVMK